MNYVVIAAYNEEKHIAKVINETKKYCENIIVVDDGSKDKTFSIAKKENVDVLRHVINLGKGATIKTGCNYAISKGAKRMVLIDADGQHDPKLIPLFLKQLEGKDIVFGYRRLSKKMPIVFRFGNWGINFLTQIMYRIKLKDTQCGYRAFTSESYKKVRWKANDYSMESEMIANAGINNLKFSEIEIETKYTDKYKGTTVLDGLKIGFNLFWWKITR
jgi:UDP-N-acetylglucosamine---dolichyl-phosphate N-acetylglucosaminyltransferase